VGGTAAATSEGSGTWFKLIEVGAGTADVAAVWTKTAAGGDAAPSFTCVTTGTSGRSGISVTLCELNDSGGTTPVPDTTGSATGGSGTLTVTTSANVTAAGEYALGFEVGSRTGSATQTWGTGGTGWSTLTSDAVSSFEHWISGGQASPPAGATLSYAPTHTFTSANMSGVIAVFMPGTPSGPAGPPPAALAPQRPLVLVCPGTGAVYA
jgi:hypothetical protein